jgi:hypothetical protein
MKNYWVMIPLAALLMAGCASVNVVKDLNDQQLTGTGETTIAHLNGDIYGYYLFGAWPLLTGDPSNPHRWAWFRDTVTVDEGVKMVTKKSKELGATKTTDMISRADSTGLQTLFLVWYYDVQVSGNAVK